jgi:hypothetical protein
MPPLQTATLSSLVTRLGDFKEEAKLREFFGRTDLTYRDSKKFFRQLVKEDIPWYRWVKRMKVAKLLRLKYVPFLGVGQRKPDETNEEWAKRVKQLEADQISSGNAERASKLMEL